MKLPRAQDKGMTVRLPFIMSLWMAIIVALLSALAPLGPPSSRLTGSAFNPATTSVVIKARGPGVAPAVKSTKPDDGNQASLPVQAISWLLPMAILLGAGRRLSSFVRLPFSSGGPWTPAVLSSFRARAPPHDFLTH